MLHRDLGWWQMGASGEPGPTATLTPFLKRTQGTGLLGRAAAVDTFPEMQGQRKGVPSAVLGWVAPSSNNSQFREEMRNLLPGFFLLSI